MMQKTLDFIITLFTQHLVPQRALSRLMYKLTRATYTPWKSWQIRWFVKRYHIDLECVQDPELNNYPNFNTFFTRALKEGARPIVSGLDEIASPVDGAVSQLGEIVGGQLFQAKGRYFDLETLLGTKERATPFYGGEFATIYLCPRDYHRIHMPVTGVLKEMVHIPGRLFSVQPRTVRSVPNLFARNERVVTVFETAHGPMAMVLVGALFVGSIETVWAGEINSTASEHVHVWNYPTTADSGLGTPIVLERGEEMGRFNMGSTVILLFGPKCVKWAEGIEASTCVRMGQLLSYGLMAEQKQIKKTA